jgi:hypothetical protein
VSDLGTARGRVTIDVSDVKRAQREVEQASRGMSQALGALGIATGAREFVQFAVAADEIATSYRRQSVAAANLAGSQERLNELMQVYERATGGALSQADALSNVTKLMSVGFADNAEELEKFARAIRGISTAMGTSQDTVTQNLILELFTQRGARLDQLGLQYDKVRQRADELAAADGNLTKEMAYQQAVLEQAEERFGSLADSAAGAKTGMEDLRREWANTMRAFGATGVIDFVAQAMANWLKDAKRDIDIVRDAVGELTAAFNRLRFAMGASVGVPAFNAPNLESGGRLGPSASSGSLVEAPRWGENQKAVETAIRDWAQAVGEIERQAYRDRLDATRDFEQQRASTIRAYNQSIAREAEDFARNRARAEQDYRRAIADVQENAARREAQQAEDLARTVAQARQDSAERLADMQEQFERTVSQRRADSAERVAEWETDRADAIAERRKDSTARLIELEEDFTRERERALRDSRDRLFSAAAQFDA